MWDIVCTQAANPWIFLSFRQRYVRKKYLSLLSLASGHNSDPRDRFFICISIISHKVIYTSDLCTWLVLLSVFIIWHGRIIKCSTAQVYDGMYMNHLQIFLHSQFMLYNDKVLLPLPYHTELVLNTLNIAQTITKGDDSTATFCGLFTNVMDRLGRDYIGIHVL